MQSLDRKENQQYRKGVHQCFELLIWSVTSGKQREGKKDRKEECGGCCTRGKHQRVRSSRGLTTSSCWVAPGPPSLPPPSSPAHQELAIGWQAEAARPKALSISSTSPQHPQPPKQSNNNSRSSSRSSRLFGLLMMPTLLIHHKIMPAKATI